MAQAQDALSPTANWMINQGMNMKVGEYRKYEWPRIYSEATENMPARSSCQRTAASYLTTWPGAPYPSIDVNDTLGGAKVMWNHENFPDFTDNVGCPWILELVNYKGEMERFYASHFWRRRKCEGRLHMDPKPIAPFNPQITYTEQWGPLYAPNDLKGCRRAELSLHSARKS